ncbi:NADPH:quinone reductase [Blastopirellula sp. JC732]|uniref:NADPH:quinone reductase n=1 Tax=Blastopirellula sediminis TaxID=2894196 RepID=A0A9X1SIE3_9BACT|nr:NADPH:quinone reductase [Blastopirellula sediminis]MCC9604486.1 NADPH:quinone reductase [Blastopirellula sediminis]MCC9632215.1 NADPH:quinone reductase [Blastopirellula sediminis]
MKAAYFTEPGLPSVIQYGDLPMPQIGPRQALVKMTAVSVNPIDTYIRGGANYWELPQPYIIGADLAGVVEEVGAEVEGLEVGDRVWCTNQGFRGEQGVFAEYSAVDAKWLYKLPDGASDKCAAACALVGVTAHLGLFKENADLQPGETLYIQGGSGGVGSMVLQMAKLAGARVIAAAGSEEKAAICRQLGADEVVCYKTENVAERIKELAPDGVNVFWETQREPDFDLIVGSLAEKGRIVLMAGRTARPEFPVGPFYVKQGRMFGFVMFKASPAEMRVCGEAISSLLGAGKLKSQIGAEFPLSEAAQAHELQEGNTLHKQQTLAGKIVLHP